MPAGSGGCSDQRFVPGVEGLPSIRAEGRMLYQDLGTALEVIALNRRWWICGAHGNDVIRSTQELFLPFAMLVVATGAARQMTRLAGSGIW